MRARKHLPDSATNRGQLDQKWRGHLFLELKNTQCPWGLSAGSTCCGLSCLKGPSVLTVDRYVSR